MIISKLHLYHFRSHQDLSVDLADGVTIIAGQNGIGKTNLLESVYTLATGSSFRDQDSELASYGHDDWRVKAIVDGVNREMRYQAGKKTTTIDDKVFGRLAKSRQLPVVLFEPDDLLLVHANPSARRDFVDRFLSHIAVSFADSKKRYDRALRQRNKLLKDAANQADNIFVWDLMLAREGSYIRAQRQRLIDRYNEQLPSLYSHIAGQDSRLRVEYKSSLSSDNYEQSLISGLKQRLERDSLVGFTSVGVHRDDIEFYLNDKPMVTSASRGEIRSLLLSLKRFEADSKHNIFDDRPIVLLDDVFSELDAKRQKQLLSLFDGSQVIITTTDTRKSNRAASYLIM